ncbi:uncharacterized protein JCM6883_001095 [Sporobolomyces salmoneus]|uniref:uncharacterized protein n=1 Tax=Sporobolomyces salmoneus TaxID=183962 RepID=UPI00316DA594
MSRAPATELVPDSPPPDQSTADPEAMEQDSTVGDSYILQFMHNPQQSPTSQREDPLQHQKQRDPPRVGADGQEGDLSCSPIDQRTETHSKSQSLSVSGSDKTSGSRHHRRASASNSQPVEGPGGSGEVTECGYLGPQTQAPQSMDTSWDKRRRVSDSERRKMETFKSEDTSDVENENENENEDQAETKHAVGRDTEEETDQLASSGGEEEEEDAVNRGGGGIDAHESQKENASAPRSSLSPLKPTAPLSLRNSRSNLEPSASAPSSSPFVADQLLNRSTVRPSWKPSSSGTSPASPAKSPLNREEEPVGEVTFNGDVSVSDASRPLMSTPGAMKLFSPAPAPTQALEAASRTRSIPTYQFVSKELVEPARSPVKPSRSLPLHATNTTSVAPDLALFASSAAAMAKPAPKGRKKKEEWDGISQDTPEDQRDAKKEKEKETKGHETQETEPESESFSPTQVHEEEEEEVVEAGSKEISMELDREADAEAFNPTPKPTAERTVDMDLDEGDSNPYLNEGGGGTLDDSTINGDLNSCSQPKSSVPEIDSSNDQPPVRQNQVATNPSPLVPPTNSASTSSSSPARSQRSNSRIDSSAQEPRGSKKRLSDISELRSSQEFPPTQFEVEATQKVYDAEKSQMSINSMEIDVTNSATWHAPFANDDSTSTSHSRRRSNPLPGRGLRRKTPPPTPAAVEQSSSPLKQSIPVAEDSFRPVNSSSPQPAVPREEPVASSSSSSSHPLQPTAEDSLALPIPPAQFFPPSQPTQPTQPTQQVAESSPDVPLAKTSLGHRPSAIRQPSPSLPRLPETNPSSNGGIIPDSEDPTQPERDEGRRRSLNRTSMPREDVGDDSDDESLPSLDEVLKKGRNRKSESKKAVVVEEEPKKTATDRKGKGKAKQVEAEGSEEEERPKKRGKKRTSSRKVQESSGEESVQEEESEPEKVVKEARWKSKKGEEKVVVDTKKKGKSKSVEEEGGSKSKGKKVVKGKGKGKKRVDEESSESPLTEEEEENDDDEAEDEPRKEPEKAKRKKPSSKTSKPVVEVLAVRAPPRRRASGPTIIERPDDEEEEAEEVQEVAPAPRKRKSEESKVVSKRAKSTTSTTVKKEPAPKRSSTARSRRSTTVSTRQSRSVEPVRPVAGPSRLRFADQEEGGEDRDDEDQEMEVDGQEEEDDEKPSIASKLLPSAPFSRCFGLWRDDGYYYPGTIKSYNKNKKKPFEVVFDDGTGDAWLRTDEVRRCELELGDWVQYFGGERGDTESQTESLSGDLRVLNLRKAGGGEDVEEGQLEKEDIVIVTSAANFDRPGGGGRTQNLLVEALRIIRVHASSQFNNRRITLADLEAFEGKTRSNVRPLPLVSAPTRPNVGAFKMNDLNSGLLSRTAFIITYASSGSTHSPNEPNIKEVKQSDRDGLLEKIKAAGGTVIDWANLFEARVDSRTGKPQVFFPSDDFAQIDTIILLADRSITTIKYLIALALGIPCCSIEFALATIREGTRIDFESFLLPAGYLDPLKFFGLGGQLRALRKSTYNLDSLEHAQQGEGILKDQSFLVIMEKPGKTKDDKLEFNKHAYVILSLLSCCSASRIDFLTLPFDSSAASKPFSSNSSEFVKSASIYSHVFLDFDESKTKMENAVKPLLTGHKGIVNMNWVKQCLMTGRLQPAARVGKDS